MAFYIPMNMPKISKAYINIVALALAAHIRRLEKLIVTPA
jgi:hypothetical protein